VRGVIEARPAGVTHDLLLARAALSRVAEPANLDVWNEVRGFGPVEAMRRILAGAVPAKVLDATAARARTVDPHADLEAAARHGIRLVVPESDEWPHFGLACLERASDVRLAERELPGFELLEGGEPVPPLALWVRGTMTIEALAVRSVGIVGSRSATPYGTQVATDLGYGLARRGFAVVSGGAYGIDSAAHRGALAAGGPTVLISAGGLDRPYPSASAELYARAADLGAVISESPPGSAPHRHRFLTRNRLIAALSTGTVIVEAAARSGAMNTARHSERLGRPLMAVPGPVTSAMSDGCHNLLRGEPARAALVTSARDVVELIGASSDVCAEADSGASGAAPTGNTDEGRPVSRRDVLDTLDADCRQVFDGFPARGSVGADELAIASGLSALRVIRALPTLELSGLIEPTPDGYRISR
jgi:DNA processing protein